MSLPIADHGAPASASGAGQRAPLAASCRRGRPSASVSLGIGGRERVAWVFRLGGSETGPRCGALARWATGLLTHCEAPLGDHDAHRIDDATRSSRHDRRHRLPLRRIERHPEGHRGTRAKSAPVQARIARRRFRSAHTVAATSRPTPAQQCGTWLRKAKSPAHLGEAGLSVRLDLKTAAFNRSATLPARAMKG